MIHHLIRGPYHNLCLFLFSGIAGLLAALGVAAVFVSLNCRSSLQEDFATIERQLESQHMRLLHLSQGLDYHGIRSEAIDMPKPRCSDCHEGEK